VGELTMKRETIFTQLGAAGTKMARILSADAELGRFLKHQVSDPLDVNLSDPTKGELLDHNIRLRPLIRLDELTESFIILNWDYGEIDDNTDFALATLSIDIFCNLDAWMINDICQRPFKIMDYIARDLNGTRLTGLGTLRLVNFELKTLSDEYSQHKMVFIIETNSSNETLK
jgi:hypothetical protein